MSDDYEESDTPVGKRLSLREVTVALKACNGSIPKSAVALGVDTYRLSRFVAVRPKLRQLIDKLRHMVVDVAEGYFSDAVMAGDVWAVRLALTTLGKDRGFTAKSEINHNVIHTNDPTKMSDQQLQQMVEERARQQRIAAKQPVLEAKVIKHREVVKDAGDFHDVGSG